MKLDTTLLRAMARAGVTAEQIAMIADDYENATAERRAEVREQNRIRQQNQRSRNAASRVTERDNALPLSPKEIPPTPPKEITPIPASKPNGFSLSERDFFAEFWIAYPRREGPNPKKPARDRFLRLVAKGTDPEALIEAARQLAADHPTPTRFVPQAVTWLNQERFDDASPVIRGDEFCPEDWASTRFLVIRFRNEHSGQDPPRAVQGGKAGYLLPAEWVASARQRTANVGLV